MTSPDLPDEPPVHDLLGETAVQAAVETAGVPADMQVWDLPDWLGNEEADLGLVPEPGGSTASAARTLEPAAGSPPHPVSVPAEPAPTAASVLEVRGNVESVDSAGVTGWVALLEGGRPVELPSVRAVDVAGNVLGQAVVTGFRQDVADAGLGTGWAGFDVPLAVGRGAVGTVVLEAGRGTPDGGWVELARAEVGQAPDQQPLAPPSLLSTFARAGREQQTVGRGGAVLGGGLWVQTAAALADQVEVSLQLVPGPAGQGRLAVLRTESAAGATGRVDLRLRLADHAPRLADSWVRLRVFPRSGAQQQLRVNVHSHAGRTALGDFVVRSHLWAELHVKVPAHACDARDLAGQDGVVWLELVVDAGAVLDVASLELVARQDQDPFECFNVELQQSVFAGAPSIPSSRQRPYTVVVPFHGKVAYTAACVASLVSSSWSVPEVLLVDDGSPAPAVATQLLERTGGRVRTLRSPFNRGYTASVNAGVQAAQTEHVVVLNNDTRVTPGWDVPLLAALDDPTVFAAGPLSNAASYQSVPLARDAHGWAVNRYPVGVSPDALAAALRRRFAGQTVDLAVLNGFCYAVRTEEFLRLGGLDELAFPQGYGEEVDLMLRARAQGRRSVVALDSFVYHYKSITFAGRRTGLSQQGTGVVRERWGARLDDAVRQMDEDTGLDQARRQVTALLAELVRESERARG